MNTNAIDQIRQAAENLTRRDALAQYEAWLGGSAPPPLPPRPEDEADPFAPAAVHAVAQAVQEEQEPGARKVLTLLHRGLLTGALDRALRPALVALNSSMVAHISYLLGEPAPPDAGYRAWLREEQPARRVELHEQLLQAWRGSTPQYLQAATRVRQAGAELGLPDADTLLATLARVDPAWLRRSAAHLLDATDGLYRRALELAVEINNLPALPAHLPLLFSFPGMDHRFTSERMLPVAGSLLERIGINLAQEKGLSAIPDPVATPRPSKAFPIHLPREVRLVVNRTPGLQAALWHLAALGHALHWLHTEPGPFPCRWPFGHRALTDGHGLLLANLLLHPATLRERGVPREVVRALIRVVRRSQLLHLRTMAALLLAGPGGPEAAADPHAAYAAALTRARIIPVSPQEAAAWPVRVDVTFAAETYLSWLLAAALQRHLFQHLGDGWWCNPSTAELWLPQLQAGQRFGVDELLVRLGQDPGAEPLDPQPLIDLLIEGCEG